VAAYSIWVVSPPSFIHNRAFEEVALSLRDAFKELGHECEVVTNPMLIKGTAIVLGAHKVRILMHGSKTPMIIYNLEQIYEDSRWLTQEYIDLLRAYPVWDYCQSNVDALAKLGIKAKLCGIGYMPSLTRIKPVEEDIDVLFCGSINDRRKTIRDGLMRHSKSMFTFAYGETRDMLIARAKIVLNIHFYNPKIFEIVRCSYPLANRKCVVSEVGSEEELERPFMGRHETDGGLMFVRYEELVDSCLHLLKSPDAIKTIANRGFEVFSKMSQVDMLRRVLE